jgi:hypothetical protein
MDGYYRKSDRRSRSHKSNRTGEMPFNSLQPPNKRKFALLTAAVLLIALAGTGMALGGNNFAIRFLAIVAGLTGVACVRRINVHTPPDSATEAPQPVTMTSPRRPSKRKFALLALAFLLIAFA